MTVRYRVKCHRLTDRYGDPCSKDATVDREIAVALNSTARVDKLILVFYTVSMCDEHAEEYDTRH